MNFDLNTISQIATIAGFGIQGSEFVGKVIKWCFKNVNGNENQKRLKDEVAIILDISQPCYNNVVEFLKKQNIDASCFIIDLKDSRGNKKRQLDHENRSEWEDVVREFSKLINAIYERSLPRKLHIFVSAPATLTLGIGCVIRTLRKPYIYNFDRVNQTYKLVIIASDELQC